MKTNRISKCSTFSNSISALNILYIPALILFVMFIFVPFFQGIIISFKEWDGYSPNYQWVGLNKYITMFSDPNFYIAVKNTFIYGIGSTLFQNIFGLLLAILLDQKLRGEKVIRTIIYMPVIISAVIMGYIWYFFFKYNGGAINDIMNLLGRDSVDWLADGSRGVPIITFVNIFQYLGSSMVIYLAGLQNIPKDYFEAADIDGAKMWTKFKNITIPLLMPAITFCVVWNLIGGLKLFDVIQAMTSGGPQYDSSSISTMMMQVYFVRMDAGYAAAMGNFMFVIISVVSIFTLSYFRNKEVEM